MTNNSIDLDSKGRIKRNGTNLGKIFRKSDGYCAYCGVRLDPFSRWTIEHAMPQSKGGGHDYNNLWPACPSCNSSKNSLDQEEFRHALTERMIDSLDKVIYALDRTCGDSSELRADIDNLKLKIANHPITFYIDTMKDA